MQKALSYLFLVAIQNILTKPGCKRPQFLSDGNLYCEYFVSIRIRSNTITSWILEQLLILFY